MSDFNIGDDIIDSRDIAERMEEILDDMRDDLHTILTSDDPGEYLNRRTDLEEYRDLATLAEQGRDYAEDWEYGVTLILDSYFPKYAEELADDIGAINRDVSWPNTCIDWNKAAEELKQDYTAIEVGGFRYWVR